MTSWQEIWSRSPTGNPSRFPFSPKIVILPCPLSYDREPPSSLPWQGLSHTQCNDNNTTELVQLGEAVSQPDSLHRTPLALAISHEAILELVSADEEELREQRCEGQQQTNLAIWGGQRKVCLAVLGPYRWFRPDELSWLGDRTTNILVLQVWMLSWFWMFLLLPICPSGDQIGIQPSTEYIQRNLMCAFVLTPASETSITLISQAHALVKYWILVASGRESGCNDGIWDMTARIEVVLVGGKLQPGNDEDIFACIILRCENWSTGCSRLSMLKPCSGLWAHANQGFVCQLGVERLNNLNNEVVLLYVCVVCFPCL